jgi:hypothetical protein
MKKMYNSVEEICKKSAGTCKYLNLLGELPGIGLAGPRQRRPGRLSKKLSHAFTVK